MGRKLSWECDNCGLRAMTDEFPTTWIHLKAMWIAEGICCLARLTCLPLDQQAKYQKEWDRTFCSKECFLKYMAKIVNSNSDSSFNPSMKV